MLRVCGINWYVLTEKHVPRPRDYNSGFIFYRITIKPQQAVVLIPKSPMLSSYSFSTVEQVQNYHFEVEQKRLEPICMMRRITEIDHMEIGCRVHLLKSMAKEMSMVFIKYLFKHKMIGIAENDSVALRDILNQHISEYLQKMKSDKINDIGGENFMLDVSELLRNNLQNEVVRRLEEENRRRIEWEQHREQMENIRINNHEYRTTSFRLMYKFLTPLERRMASEHNKILINTDKFGIFVVNAVNGRDLVHRFQFGNYICSYCVMFSDYTIPDGDYVLMKVSLLKADPEKLIKIANKFHRPPQTSTLMRIFEMARNEGVIV